MAEVITIEQAENSPVLDCTVTISEQVTETKEERHTITGLQNDIAGIDQDIELLEKRKLEKEALIAKISDAIPEVKAELEKK